MSNIRPRAKSPLGSRQDEPHEGITRIMSLDKQRNGIGGRPFSSVTFTYFDGEKSHTLIAIVPENPQRGECFVVSPASPDLGWRGDTFMEEIVSVINGWRVVDGKGPSYA